MQAIKLDGRQQWFADTLQIRTKAAGNAKDKHVFLAGLGGRLAEVVLPRDPSPMVELLTSSLRFAEGRRGKLIYGGTYVGLNDVRSRWHGRTSPPSDRYSRPKKAQIVLTLAQTRLEGTNEHFAVCISWHFRCV